MDIKQILTDFFLRHLIGHTCQLDFDKKDVFQMSTKEI